MSDEKLTLKRNLSSILIGLVSLIALFFGRKHPFFKWVIALVTMFIIGIYSFFALSSLGWSPLIYPLVIIVFNILVCLFIQAPKKWILFSTTVISLISLVWGAKWIKGRVAYNKTKKDQMAQLEVNKIDQKRQEGMALATMQAKLYASIDKKMSVYFKEPITLTSDKGLIKTLDLSNGILGKLQFENTTGGVPYYILFDDENGISHKFPIQVKLVQDFYLYNLPI